MLASTRAIAAGVPLSAIPPRAYAVATYDGANLRLYVNGVQIALRPVSGAADHTSAPLEIGSYAGQAVWSGEIDEVAVYDRALSPAVIAARYRLGLDTHPPSPAAYRDAVLGTSGLVGYWRLDDSGTVAADSHGHANGSYTPGATRGVPGLITAEADKGAEFNGKAGSVKVPGAPSLDLSHAFTLEAWVTTVSVGNRHIVSRVGSYFLKTDLLGRWSAGLYIKGKILTATSRFAARGPAGAQSAPGQTQTQTTTSAKRGKASPSPAWLLVLVPLVAAGVFLTRRRAAAGRR